MYAVLLNDQNTMAHSMLSQATRAIFIYMINHKMIIVLLLLRKTCLLPSNSGRRKINNIPQIKHHYK